MSARCSESVERLAGYFDESLPAADRRTLREHLSECGSCRDEAAAFEPSVVFARFRPEEVSAEDVARVLAGVRAGLALKETERKLATARSRGRHRVAAIGSAAALAAMTLVLPASRRQPAPAPTAATAPVEAPAPAAGFAPVSERDANRTFPADATIYDLNPGAGSSEPRVVWIVDRSLDI